jgi:tripartite-type tricarboxylate transporter receptor subunit TctC
MKLRLGAMLCVLLVATLPSQVCAQDAWPARSLRLIIGFPPGGALDALARAIVVPMGKALGQSVVVENRPGAAQTLAAEMVAKAEPDGYSIGLVDSGPLTVSPHFRQMAFDANKSFTPIGSVAKLPLILVASNASGLTGLQDVIRAAQARPGSLSYASVGAGSMHNLAGEYLKSLLKLDILHVPYKGAALAAPDVIAGRVALMFSGVSSGAGWVRDKRVVAIGVTSLKRSAALPAVPTLAEQGLPGFDSQGWVGLFGPAGVAPAIVAKLNVALREALKDPTLITQEVVRGGNEMLSGSAEELVALIAADDARWGKIIRDQGIRAE